MSFRRIGSSGLWMKKAGILTSSVIQVSVSSFHGFNNLYLKQDSRKLNEMGGKHASVQSRYSMNCRSASGELPA